jgi:hypothetical protein
LLDECGPASEPAVDAGLYRGGGGVRRALERAITQEAFAYMFVSIVQDAGGGLLFYRFAALRNL